MELPQEEEAAQRERERERERFQFLHSFFVRIASLRAVSHQSSGDWREGGREREHVFFQGF